MNILSTFKHIRVAGILSLAVAAVLLLPGCATVPESPVGSTEVRTKLSVLQSNTKLAEQIPVELREAEVAVKASEKPVGDDVALGEHRIFIADRKIEIATAIASTRYGSDCSGRCSK